MVLKIDMHFEAFDSFSGRGDIQFCITNFDIFISKIAEVKNTPLHCLCCLNTNTREYKE